MYLNICYMYVCMYLLLYACIYVKCLMFRYKCQEYYKSHSNSDTKLAIYLKKILKITKKFNLKFSDL